MALAYFLSNFCIAHHLICESAARLQLVAPDSIHWPVWNTWQSTLAVVYRLRRKGLIGRAKKSWWTGISATKFWGGRRNIEYLKYSELDYLFKNASGQSQRKKSSQICVSALQKNLASDDRQTKPHTSALIRVKPSVICRFVKPNSLNN